MRKRTIRLFWWSEVKLMHKDKENYGDLLGAYLIKKITSKDVLFAHPKKWSLRDYWQPIYATAGSILAHVNKKCIVWGSGIISRDQKVKPATFLAVRGPETRQALIEQGYNVPEVYGDPGLLLPNYFNPKVEKVYKLGIVAHYVNYKEVSDWYESDKQVLVVNLMTNDIEATTKEILQCETIISSSLHGVIISHAYGIPAIWVKFTNKLFGDDIKFADYFKSVDIKPYSPKQINEKLEISKYQEFFETNIQLPKKEKIKSVTTKLMESCPFLD